MKSLGRKSGFTLIEMAIVLVIIGIILAGVMKGRDIVRGSQVKQFSQGFAQKWVTIASTYYDKTGQHLCDGVENGGLTLSPDGLMDNQTVFSTTDATKSNTLRRLQDVGITPCTMIKSDLENDTSGAVRCTGGYNIWARTVEGEFSGRTTVYVGFASVQLNPSGSTNGPIRNAVYFVNVPIDVAIGLDTLIDGQADGQNGNFQLEQPYNTPIGLGTSTFHLNTSRPVGISTVAYPSLTGAAQGSVGTVINILDY